MLRKSTKQIMMWVLVLLTVHTSSNAQDSPEITSWMLSDGVTTCKYYDTNANIIDTGVEANVQAVWYDCDYVWIEATGTPDYLTGPFPGNPSVPDDQNLTFVITRNPQEETGTKTVNGLGVIGYFINGVGVFNSGDGMSYNNQGVWNQDAIYYENGGFDCSRGHPAMATYHHHQNPAPFDISANPQSTICTTYPSTGLYTPNAAQHSPLLGFSLDGFPIYGPYGYANTDGTGSISLMVSGYELRNITQRTTYADGTSVTAGPAVSATYPLGAFSEDYEFTGNGDLDKHNGRFAITPEYPCGTYAYYITMDADGISKYPYIIGPEFYGVVVNCGGTGGSPVVDCNATPPPPTGTPCCGDGQCNGSEDSTTCPGDCTGGGSTVSCTPTTGAVQYTGSTCLTANAGNDPVLGCSTTNLAGSATGATTYSWCTNDGNIVSGSTSLSPSIDQVGTYYLTASDANCCSNTSSVTVTQSCVSNPNVVVQMKVYLEGFYNISTGLMTTDLYTTGVINTSQPFSGSPWNYGGTESVANLSAISVNTVDWVLVEVRDVSNNFTIVEQKAAFLLSNGDVVDIDGVTSGVNFSSITSGSNYYLSVKSRNHLGVLSNTTVNLPNTVSYDFTNNSNVFESSSQVSALGNGSYALYAGDINSDGVISVADFNVYVNELATTSQYVEGDLDGNNSVTVADFNAYRPNASIIGVQQIRY